MIFDIVAALVIFFWVLPVCFDILAEVGAWMVVHWKLSLAGIIGIWALVEMGR